MAKEKVAFDEAGYPVRGRHRLTLTAFRQVFVEAIPTRRRRELWEKFEAMAKEAFASGIVKSILVGGSFASKEPEPNDVDFVIVLRQDVVVEKLPVDKRVWVDRRAFGRRFDLWMLDMFSVRAGSGAERHFVDFFCHTRHPEHERGVIEVIPDDNGCGSES